MDKKMKKNGFLRFCACLSAAAFLALGLPAAASPLAAYAAEEGGRRVFDEADLFTDQEEEQLEDSLLTAREETGMDLVIATCLDADGKSGQEYANDFYDMGGFGTGDDHSGALFLIDMDNRELVISTTGEMIDILTDARQDRILDEVYEAVSDGSYYEAGEIFTDFARDFCRLGVEAGQYQAYEWEEDRPAGLINGSLGLFEFIGAILVAAAAGAIGCSSVKRRYAMEDDERSAEGFHLSYRSSSHFDYVPGTEHLVNKFVTQHRIRTERSRRSGGSSGSGRSTVRRSSSGRVHGGSSRRF